MRGGKEAEQESGAPPIPQPRFSDFRRRIRAVADMELQAGVRRSAASVVISFLLLIPPTPAKFRFSKKI